MILALAVSMAALAQTAPGQPATGPGGNDYLYSVTASGPYWAAGHEGDNQFRYFLYEPAPAPAQAPVVLFLHGVFALDPSYYANWMNHIVRKGYVVVWVQYQAGTTPTWRYIANAEVAWKDALKRLDNPAEQHVRPERDNNGAYMTGVGGHSAGAFLAMVLAARATRTFTALPQPKAIFAIEPGSTLIPGEDFYRIPSATKLLLLAGEDDTVVCLQTAVNMWTKTAQIPDPNRDFLLARSDARGTPAQIANHFFPNNDGYRDTAAIDARDYFITYRLSVAVLNCAFRGTDCHIGLGNGSAAQTDLGLWSDGVPVKPLQWTASPIVLTAPCQ
ncbi:MAG: alpha/beta hydrolase fold domain-containing protein [Bryobacteraceae bacterium]